MNKIQESSNYMYAQDENNGIVKSTGITLIALIVTIIILIILAAVSLNLLLGQNGIIKRAQEGAKETKIAEFKEQVEMDIQDVITGLIVEGKTVTGPSDPEFIERIEEKEYDVEDKGDGSITLEKDGGTATVNPDWSVEVEGVPQTEGPQDTSQLEVHIRYSTTLVTHENVIATIETNREIQTPDGWEPQDSTHYTKSYNKNTTENVTITDLESNTTSIEIEITNKYTRIYDNKGLATAIIPSGFTASGVAGETEIADGKVVKGPDLSEFVWVPVPNAAIDVTGMTDNNINAAISKEVSLEYYPMAIKIDNTDYKGVLYTFSGDTLPAVVTPIIYTTNGTGSREPAYLTDIGWGDASSSNTVGITEASLQTEYNSMAVSVITNGGFYIGRYETSLTGTKTQSKANQYPMTGYTGSGNRWWGMYDKQKKYVVDNSIASVTSSMIYGSQWDQVMIWMRNIPNPDASNKPYIVDSTDMGWYSNNAGITQNTGTLPKAKVNNIFDMAGNVYDWTQEAKSTTSRVFRRRYESIQCFKFPSEFPR